MQADIEIFFPPKMGELKRGEFIRARLPMSYGLPILSCGWSESKTWIIRFAARKPRYVLKYREPGKRANTERWATRDVDTVNEAIEFMNANKERAFLPAFVQTRSWSPQTVAILN